MVVSLTGETKKLSQISDQFYHHHHGISPGEHAIQLVVNGYKDGSSQVTVKANSIVNVTGNLEQK